MLSPKVGLLRDVLEEHLEEIAFLWELRRDGILSPERTLSDLGRLEARMEAHVDGLLLARGELLDLVGAGLESDDPPVAFASAFALLRSGREGARAVMEAFLVSKEGRREGLCEALAHGDLREVREDLTACLTSADPGLAVAAATALALQRAPGLPGRVDERLLGDPDPGVRSAAWRLVPFLREAPREEVVRQGLEDADPAVALEAVVAAAWFSLPAALEACRARARSGGGAAEWLRLLAVLGDAPDLGTVLSSGGDRNGAGRGTAGPRALGALGHPRGVETLVATMGDEDPERAAAAGAAFLKVTGFDASGDARAPVHREGEPASDGDEELLDEVTLPDAGAAAAFWSGARGSFGGGTRWCRGHDLSAGCPGELPAALDMESRWETRLRGRFTGTWKGDAAGLFRMAPRAD